MKNRIFIFIAIIILVGFFILKGFNYTNENLSGKPNLLERGLASLAIAVKSPFNYYFTIDGRLNESGNMADSTSPYWWLNSGAYMYLRGGEGMTIQGDLPDNDKWRMAYNLANSQDTDNGYHPQNIFRLITRSKWLNFSQQVSFKITRHTLSDSPERQGYSGVLFFNRYQDSNNLYYTGVRDDGDVVIKSKKGGVYKTLAEKKYFPGTYDREKNPSLLPSDTYIGMKSAVLTNPDNTVTIKLYLDETNTGTWKEVLSVTDKDRPILTSGYAGIRIDYKDVIFDNYKNINISSF